MNVSAIGSSLAGIQAAQAMQSSAAQTIASGQGDLIDGVVNAKSADVAMQVNVSMLRQAMDADKYLIDVLVR
jgi:type III secretion system FlhB-like substrate exporter